VADAVKTALSRVASRGGTNQDGSTTGVDAKILLGYVVTGDVLESPLVSVWNSSDPKPDFVKFNP